jgi:hypothetical protein
LLKLFDECHEVGKFKRWKVGMLKRWDLGMLKPSNR